MISGRGKVIAHLGYTTESFKAPMIYNPWFETNGIDAAVVPLGVTAADFAALFPALFRITTLHGALITMPHKVAVTALVDELTTNARIAGSCNAVLKRPDGSLLGDMFDGDGFVRGAIRKGCVVRGAAALVVGSGGVGSAIAASLAAAGLRAIGLFDVNAASAEALAARLRGHYPSLRVGTGSADPAGWDIVVNATPLGMRADDPLPLNPDRIGPGTFVGEVVMKEEFTPLLRAARAKGCRVQVGTDMLFEMIPAYLEFFGFGSATPDQLRAVARITY
ncbi:shikimate dehydrogenase family protein [Rhodopila sp.]|uniref:shikimate dehydrogenase family protein n=1 Tax=Rhodopila sp. TaxID=2480087 RepID=UPI002BE0D7BF|nr:shikimate dehydrogenase [Rhodopila sp.]HVZ08406.1 shikimate dehydrogenase [Rhodopila sp.]